MAKRKVNYLNKRDLLAQVVKSKTENDYKMNDELAKMLSALTTKYAKSPQFSGYSYREDMEAFAMMMLVKTWYKFDENRSDNPFAFYTQCVKNSFILFLKQEKRQRNFRDEMLIRAGLNPSHTYMLEYEDAERERHALHDEIVHPDPPKEKEAPLYE